MVDLHSHFLPGVDDGAQTLEESLEMLHLAAASGTTDIVATPHANSEFTFDPAVIEQLFRDLAGKTAGLISLHKGCDFHLNFDNLMDALDSPAKYTVNGGRYLMVELPDLVSLSAMQTALSRLLNVRIIPVITHPERNPSVQPRLKELEAWVRSGCLLQVTGQSLLGRFGSSAQRAGESLLNSDLVHFIASDAHDCNDRPPDLSKAYQLVLDRWGKERADALFVSNPSAVIWDEALMFVAPKPSKKSLFSFWK